MKKDDVKTFVTIVVICLIIVVIFLLLNRKSNSERLEPVNEYNTFFAVTNYVNNYLDYNSSADNSKLYDILYTKYINNKEITTNNIFDVVKKFPIDSNIKVSKMEYVKIKNDYIYYIEGKINQITYDGNEEIENNFRVLVLTEFDTLSYAVYPLEQKDNYKKIIDNIKKITIESNSNNKMKDSSLITKEQVCVFYLSDYIDKMNNNIEEAYNILDEQSKKTYSLEEYEKYVKDNYKKITTSADKCLLSNTDSKRIYTVVDKNKNKYVFNEKDIMNYTASVYFYDETTTEE